MEDFTGGQTLPNADVLAKQEPDRKGKRLVIKEESGRSSSFRPSA
ncbi:hypothetical protein NYO67_10247 [Aspergillus flavus]|nr:hypothetical protein NYO67_10247 [Aspergillus flavus]